MSPNIVVVGQTARDLVLRAPAVPAPGDSQRVDERIERLGGKGANQAVGLRQLHPSAGDRVTLVSVLGEDAVGAAMLDEANASGLDTSAVVRRGETALLLDLVTPDGENRLIEHVPPEALLTVDDVGRAAGAFAAADAVVLQLQQPAATIVAAARRGVDAGALVVVDGAVAGSERAEILRMADVIRADTREAGMLAGGEVADVREAVQAARSLIGGRTKIVAFAAPGADVVVDEFTEHVFPHDERAVMDPTGGGDAFVAGLVTALLARAGTAAAGALGHAAAGRTVRRLGGRPDLAGLAGEIRL